MSVAHQWQIKNKCWLNVNKKLDVKNTQYGNKVIHENEAAYRPRHICRAAERDGPHRLSEVNKVVCVWKRHLLMKVDFRRVVFIMGSWKGCPRLRNEYWFGLNGGRIWYKEWFGLLAMALKRPASAVPANCSTVQTRLASCHRCALRNKPFIRPVEHAIDQLSMPLTSWACHYGHKLHYATDPYLRQRYSVLFFVWYDMKILLALYFPHSYWHYNAFPHIQIY